MAARKGLAPKRQAQATEPEPTAAVPGNTAPPSVQDPVILTVGSDGPVAQQDPAPPKPIDEADADDAGRYPVLSPLRFNGRHFRPEDPDANEVVMPRDQATALQDIDVLGEELT